MNRDQLISHCDEVMGTAHGYPDMDAYVARRETLYRRYCIGKSRAEEALVWMKLLSDDFGRDIANLGCYLALREDDASIFHRALNTASVWGQLTMASGVCDHSLYAWTVLPLVLSARRFDDIEKMLPIQNGLSKNGLASSVCIVNLVMLLFYREPAWEKPVLVSAKKVLQKRCTLEEKAAIGCLLALVDGDWGRFSSCLSDVSAAKRRSREYGENAFTRQVSYMAMGLYALAHHVRGDEMPISDALRDDAVFRLIDSDLGDGAKIRFHVFDDPLGLLNMMEMMERPAMFLADGPKQVLDIERYRNEIVARLDG